MIVLRLEAPQTIAVGSLGPVPFAEGYYVYVGSAKKNLDQCMAHHRALRKKMHWHMDYLRKETDFVGAIPIRTCDDLEHDLARALSEIADWDVPEFGCSDCHCRSHLFGFRENPMHLPSFLKIEERFEIDRLQKYF